MNSTDRRSSTSIAAADAVKVLAKQYQLQNSSILEANNNNIPDNTADVEAALEGMNALSQSSSLSEKQQRQQSKRKQTSSSFVSSATTSTATSSYSPDNSNKDDDDVAATTSGTVKRVRRSTTTRNNSSSTQQRQQTTTSTKSKHCHSWETMYEHLVVYNREHGNSMVPRSYETPLNESLIVGGGSGDDTTTTTTTKSSNNKKTTTARTIGTGTGAIKLGKWVDKQRQRKNVIQADRKEKLDKLGFVWVVQVPWDTMYERLIAFKNEHGHCLVPQKYNADPKLGVWVSNQRTIKKQRGKLIDGRVDKLNAIGFTWWPPKLRNKRAAGSKSKGDDNKNRSDGGVVAADTTNLGSSLSMMEPITIPSVGLTRKNQETTTMNDNNISSLRSLYAKKRSAQDTKGLSLSLNTSATTSAASTITTATKQMMMKNDKLQKQHPYYGNDVSQFFIPDAEKNKLLVASLEKAQQNLGFLNQTCVDDDDDDDDDDVVDIGRQHHQQTATAGSNQLMPAVTPYYGMFSSGLFANPAAVAATAVAPRSSSSAAAAVALRRGSMASEASERFSAHAAAAAAAATPYDPSFYESMINGGMISCYGNKGGGGDNDHQDEEEYDEEMILKFLRETKEDGDEANDLLATSHNVDDFCTRVRTHYG